MQRVRRRVYNPAPAEIENEHKKAAVSPRSNESSPDRRAGKYTIPTPFRGTVAERDWEVSLLSVSPTRIPCPGYRPHGERPLAYQANTDPPGKRQAMSSSAVGPPRGQEVRIPTPWGKNTDPTGKGRDREARRAALQIRFQAVRLLSGTGYLRTASSDWPSPANTDRSGKEYRPRGERIPTLVGESYRFLGENLPTPAGDFTERRGGLYRPLGETPRTKRLQIHGFVSFRSVYMMFCLCLMFCLVNREGLGG